MNEKIKYKNVCSKCSFPLELCICENLEAESQSIIISNSRRRWGKIVTIVKFQGDFNIDLDELSTKAKKKCASGGTYRKSSIEVQGEHRFKLKELLIKQGFSENNILIRDFRNK